MDNVVHGLSLATITGRWLGETPFVQFSTTWALTCPEMVHQRPQGRSKLAAPHTMWALTHTHLTALFPGLPRWAGTRKEKPIWILLKQETVSGSGISWAVCKSAPRSRQITPPLCFFTGRMPFLPPNQQRQSTVGSISKSRDCACCCNECHYSIVGCTEEVLGGQDITAHHCYLRTTGVHLQRWLTKR